MAETETLSAAIPSDIEHHAARLMKLACDRELTIATAESCTGGLLASLLTDVEGAAHSFECGIVAYTEAAKQELLGVPAAVLAEDGAVSRRAAIAMADGALIASEADIALAITGFAGPGAPDDEPGLVHFACARRGGLTVQLERHFGDIGRGSTRIEALRAALDLLDQALEQR